MIEQICDLETVKPQEIPIKVYVIFYNIEICYRGCGEKTSFFCNSLIHPCIYLCRVVGLPMVEGIFSLLFYCESGINQYDVQKSLTDVSRGSLLLLNIVCLRYIVLS